MDLNKLAKTLLSSDSISSLSDLTGTSNGDVTKVLSQALPALLNGANEQAKDKDTAEGFANALSQHAKDDTKDLSSFMSKVDMADGAKIIAHLLGSGESDIIEEISDKTDVSKKDTASIISAVAPLLMSLLGQQTNEDEDKDSGVEGLLGALLNNVDVGDLLTGLLTDNTASSTSGKKKKGKKKADDSNDAGKLIGNILQGLLK